MVTYWELPLKARAAVLAVVDETQASFVHPSASSQSASVTQTVLTLWQLPPEQESAVSGFPSSHWAAEVQQPGVGA
jgi:hypothetical protein